MKMTVTGKKQHVFPPHIFFVMVTTRSASRSAAKAQRRAPSRHPKKSKWSTKKYAKPIRPGAAVDIHKAIRDGNLYAVKKAIVNGQDLETEENVSQFLPKCSDTDPDYYAQLEAFIERYREKDTTLKIPYRPLGLAAMHAGQLWTRRKFHNSIALALIRAGADLNECGQLGDEQDPDAFTPLGACVELKNYSLMRALLDAGADVEARSYCYTVREVVECTPLMIAIKEKDEKAIKILLKYEASKTGGEGYTVREIAVDYYDEHIFKKVLKFKLTTEEKDKLREEQRDDERIKDMVKSIQLLERLASAQ